MAYYNKNDWDDPAIYDWDDDPETAQMREYERQCFPIGLVGGIGIGVGFGGFGCFPRRICFPRRFCFPREGFCFPREAFCYPRQFCYPRPCYPI